MKVEVTYEVDIVDKISSIGIARTVKEYNLSEDLIYGVIDEIGVDTLLNSLKFEWSPSQKFIQKCLENEIFEKDFIYELNMGIYSKFDSKFILENEEDINWNRMLLWLFNEGDINVYDYIDVISKYKLWHLASSIPLPIDFIREYKDKIDWRFVSFLNDFTDSEREEFSDYILQITKRRPTLKMKKVADDIKDMIGIKKTISQVLKRDDE